MITGGILSTKTTKATQTGSVNALPISSQARQVAQLQQRLPGATVQPALVVYRTRSGSAIPPAQLAQIERSLPKLAAAVAAASPASTSEVLGPLRVGNAGAVAVASISISIRPDDSAVKNRVTALRAEVASTVPAGVGAYVTGAPAFTTDVANVFNGADTTLLLATVLVVALLLLITYRSPILWIIPLLVVGIAEQVAATLSALLAPHLGIRLDDASTGIAQVLVFGAGTDYALLLIARYRDQLRHEESRYDAMRIALGRTSTSIIASGATVTLALATLLLADLGGTRALGLAGLTGILTVMAFALVVLPAALVVCGRGVFWPLVPRSGDLAHRDGRVFARIGQGVARRPGAVAVLSLVVLALLASLGLGTRIGLSQTQIFRATPESVIGQKILATSFPAGASEPAIVISNTGSAAAIASAVRGIPGIANVAAGRQAAGLTELLVTLGAPPSSAASFRAIDAMRVAVAAVPGAHAVVGGDVATELDTRRTNRRDAKLIVPLILLIVLAVLILLLRSLLAPVLLVGTVLATYLAALGCSWFLFTHLFGYAALDTGVRFYSFLFLVALGVDYNIFLTARAREEARVTGTRDGMLRALRATGGVITSAGILLAAVFAVLGVLPLITLTQIGVIVCIGVLLDTLLVRTVLVPAIALLLGATFWWPGRPGPSADRAPAAEPESVTPRA